LVLSAKSSIFISQQELFSCLPKKGTLSTDVKFDDRLFAALASQIIDLRASTPGYPPPIQVVLSAGAGGASDGYGNGWSLRDVAVVLKEVVARELQARALEKKPTPPSNQTANQDARTLICAKVGLAHIRSTPADKWPNGKAYANHAKLVVVDNQAFYIGSENLYPSQLQELGFIVEDRTAAGDLFVNYSSNVWRDSSRDAYINPGTLNPRPCPTDF
jgi:hypothetical protein